MIVRAAAMRDARQMTDILNEVIAIGGTTAYEDPLSPSYFEKLITSDDPKVFLHVVETEDGIQGLQWVEPFDPPDAHIGGIATFAKPGTAKKGIGTALFETTHKASMIAAYKVLSAKIRADNTGGLAYYGKMGFTDHSILEGEPLKDGTPIDRIIKRLSL